MHLYEQGLESAMEKVAFLGMAAKGLGYVGGKILGAGSKIKNLGADLLKESPYLKNDYTKIRTSFLGSKPAQAVKNSDTYKHFSSNYTDIKNKYKTFTDAHPTSMQIGLGAAGMAGGAYLGNKTYRSLQRLGRQIPSDYQQYGE